MLIGQCNLDGVEVFALNVLHERHFHDVLIFDGSDVGWYGGQSGYLRRAPPALAGDDLEALVVDLSQRDGLNDAYLLDAVGQLLQRLGVELATGLVGIGLYL